MASPLHLGIDFGTSHTVATLRDADDNQMPILFDETPLLPSAVMVSSDGDISVGRDAVHAARMHPSNFEPHPKRRVDDGTLLLGEREVAVVELFSAVLGRVRRECQQVAGRLPAQVTLTHPAQWGRARRAILVEAARAAGFGEVGLVAEPVAAAVYFEKVQRHRIPVGKAVVVHDLGGGTFDASVVRRTRSGFEVLAVDGLDDLGGADVDEALVGLLGQRFGDHPAWRGLTAPSTPEQRRANRVLYEEVRTAKERLSRKSRTDLPIPMLNVDTHLTREELESVTRPLLGKALVVTREVVSSAGRAATAGVFLVGGASRMPLVATMLHQEFGTAPTAIAQPELVVSQGATLAAEVADPVPSPPASVASGPTPASHPDDTPPVPGATPQPHSRKRWMIYAFAVVFIGLLVVAGGVAYQRYNAEATAAEREAVITAASKDFKEVYSTTGLETEKALEEKATLLSGEAKKQYRDSIPKLLESLEKSGAPHVIANADASIKGGTPNGYRVLISATEASGREGNAGATMVQKEYEVTMTPRGEDWTINTLKDLGHPQ